jgi:hypothetical protein
MTKLEEIARAIAFHASIGGTREDVVESSIEQAKAVLLVLREPTDGMRKAGAVVVPSDLAVRAYQVMIDHILREKPNE